VIIDLQLNYAFGAEALIKVVLYMMNTFVMIYSDNRHA